MKKVKNKKTKNLRKWLNSRNLSKEIKKQIKLIDKNVLYDSFYKDLDIGTAGIRAQIGLGTNRLNIYTVRKIVYFYGKYLQKKAENNQKISVVIGNDTRLKSVDFANEASKVLRSLGIKVYIFPSYIPTPVLSYCIRMLKVDGGIMVTASHNPYNYNGIKLYNNYGSQLTKAEGEEFLRILNDEFDYFIELKPIEKEEKIAKQIFESYAFNISKISLSKEKKSDIKFIFSPLHGTSIGFAENIFNKMGYNYLITPSQNIIDPYFETAPKPNPEFLSVFNESLKLTKDYKCDFLICFDPDSDRMGVVVCCECDYYHLSGNETGAILLKYLCDIAKNLDNSVLITTIVTNHLGLKIAEKYNVKTVVTLTGFKNIAQQIEIIKKENKNYLFGYEESCGYSCLDIHREKDAFQAAVLLIEAAKYYKLNNKTLLDVLNDLYNEFGYFVDKQISVNTVDKDGNNVVNRLMSYFRDDFANSSNINIIKIIDVFKSVEHDLVSGIKKSICFPQENVLKFYMSDDSWLAIRPSGTEPIIKIYISCTSNKKENAIRELEKIEKEIMKIINGVLN